MPEEQHHPSRKEQERLPEHLGRQARIPRPPTSVPGARYHGRLGRAPTPPQRRPVTTSESSNRLSRVPVRKTSVKPESDQKEK